MINFQYHYQITAADLWKVAMLNMYTSLAGMCNIIFTVAMMALVWSQWSTVSEWWRPLMLFGCVWFPLLHPALVYQRSKQQVKRSWEDMNIRFDEKGISVCIGCENSDISWEKVKGVLKKPMALIIFSDRQHGYILPDRVTGTEKNDLYTYIHSKIG